MQGVLEKEISNTETLHLTREWDKVFLRSDRVDHKKATFHNRYGITLAAGILPAIAVCGPFGAVKEYFR